MEETPDVKVSAVLAKAKWQLFKWMVGFAVLAAVITLIIPAKWQADADLLLPMPDDSLIDAVISGVGGNGGGGGGGGGGGAASALNALVGNSADPLEIIKGLLLSHRVLAQLSHQTGVEEDRLQKRLEVKLSDKANQINIHYADRDRKLALNVVTKAMDDLQLASDSVSVTMARMKAKNFKGVVAEKEAELKATEDKIAAYQLKATTAPDPSRPYSAASTLERLRLAEYNLRTLSEQLSVGKSEAARLAKPAAELPVAIPGAAPWRAKIVEAEFNLRVASQKFGPKAPEYVLAEGRLAAAKKSYQIEIERYLESVNKGIDPILAGVYAKYLVAKWQVEFLTRQLKIAPTEAVEVQRLLREITIKTDTLVAVRGQYEKAVVEANVDRARWTVLNDPYLEREPINKNYGLDAFIGALVGFMAGSGWCLYKARKPA